MQYAEYRMRKAATEVNDPAGTGPRVIVGILGGMGPAATADFYRKLVEATPATTDQQHLQVVVWSDPTVPDRTAALLDDGPDPTPWLRHGVHVLTWAGADLIAVPCNTAHAFFSPTTGRNGVPVVHMIDQAVRAVAELAPPVRRVGLLATTGTVRAGLYQDWLGRAGLAAVLPTDDEQERLVAPAIRAVMAGHRGAEVAASLESAGASLARRGAQVIVAGCTEIPLVLGERCGPVTVIDPTRVLARAVVAAALGTAADLARYAVDGPARR
jgi:aspartate racemase